MNAIDVMKAAKENERKLKEYLDFFEELIDIEIEKKRRNISYYENLIKPDDMEKIIKDEIDEETFKLLKMYENGLDENIQNLIEKYEDKIDRNKLLSISIETQATPKDELKKYKWYLKEKSDKIEMDAYIKVSGTPIHEVSKKLMEIDSLDKYEGVAYGQPKHDKEIGQRIKYLKKYPMSRTLRRRIDSKFLGGPGRRKTLIPEPLPCSA